MTCGEIEAYAKQVPEGADDCKYFRDRGMAECGCTDVFTAEPNVVPDDSTYPPTVYTDDPTFVPTFEPSTEPTFAVTNGPTTTKATSESGNGSSTATSAPTKNTDEASSAPTASPTNDVQPRANLQFLKDSSEASSKVATVFWLGITSAAVALAWCY